MSDVNVCFVLKVTELRKIGLPPRNRQPDKQLPRLYQLIVIDTNPIRRWARIIVKN